MTNHQRFLRKTGETELTLFEQTGKNFLETSAKKHWEKLRYPNAKTD